ncbi:MAG: hypothetical protein ACE5FQ_02775 [Thiogranum sp.]
MEKNSCVSIYPGSRLLEHALHELQGADFDLRQVSVVGKSCHVQGQAIGFGYTGEDIRFYGPRSDFWEEVWGLLTDAACVWLPGIGPLAAAGYIVTLMVRGQQGAGRAAGFSLPGAALYGIGIPRCSIDEYEQAIGAENYLLLVSGARHDVERACAILHGEAQQVTVHSA